MVKFANKEVVQELSDESSEEMEKKIVLRSIKQNEIFETDDYDEALDVINASDEDDE